MGLSDILSEESVLFCTGIKTKAQLIDVIADHASKRLKQDREAVRETLVNREALGSTAEEEMRPGDVFVIDTPGGGGYGKT